MCYAYVCVCVCAREVVYDCIAVFTWIYDDDENDLREVTKQKCWSPTLCICVYVHMCACVCVHNFMFACLYNSVSCVLLCDFVCAHVWHYVYVYLCNHDDEMSTIVSLMT